MYVPMSGILPNMSFVTANTGGIIPEIHCISALPMATNTTLISPRGINIVSTTVDPFDVKVGNASDPGYLMMTQDAGHHLIPSYEGIYSCNFMQENGIVDTVQFGIYGYNFTGKLEILCLLLLRTHVFLSLFRLSCDHLLG